MKSERQNQNTNKIKYNKYWKIITNQTSEYIPDDILYMINKILQRNVYNCYIDITMYYFIMKLNFIDTY